MRPFLNFLISILTASAFGQTASDSVSLAIPSCDTILLYARDTGKSYLSDALLVKSEKIALFTIHFQGKSPRKSTIYVVDYNGKKLISKIELKNWRYEYRSWVSNDTLLYLAKGALFSRIELINLKTGEIIESKFESRYHKPSEENGQAEYFGDKKLYCYGNTIFDNNLKKQISMIYDPEIKGILIYTYTN